MTLFVHLFKIKSNLWKTFSRKCRKIDCIFSTQCKLDQLNNKKFVLTSPKKSFFKNVFRSDLVWLMTYIDNFMLLRVAVGNDTTFHRNLVHFQSTQIYFSDVFRFFRHFCGNGLRLKVVNYFCQGNASYMFERIPNAPLFVINID